MARGKGGGSGNPRADVRNPTSVDYKAANDNRANQLNPKHPAYSSSRRGNSPGQKGK